MFERFEWIEFLGQGAFGSVYRVRDRVLGREMALKQLRQVDAASLARFKREFRAVRGLTHPNLVQLGELFEHRGEWAFSMELIEGTDLVSWSVERDERSLRDAIAQLVIGLDALHGAGFVHRDVKPSNVLVTAAGRVVLLDFGLLAFSDDAVRSSGHYGVGTVAYMAPEQLDGHVSAVADLYAVGVVLYEALTGQLPFEGEVMQIIHAKATRLPNPPGPGLPLTFAGIGDADARAALVRPGAPTLRARDTRAPTVQVQRRVA